ncbi:hypothetical protein EC844_12670 [Acinetobacter calcoaceticus]|uniref:Uncharacterized protein n=1 Tax=Acinetobacter calcoaceticus TaxID=471 RepID=A0A4R1XFM3_ACICA|nr:hypothetical protein EC844_12670 [Acinetobacter calcoaceticus]
MVFSYIEVSDFALELTDTAGEKHYFKGCFPEVIFNIGDQVKVIAIPLNNHYAYAYSVIDAQKQYMWTGQQVERGRINYRIFSSKIGAFFGFLGILSFILFFVFTGDAILILTLDFVVWTLVFCFLSLILIGWRIGASFDDQSSLLEAILKKIGFYKPTMISLGSYSVSMVNIKNKVKDDEFFTRWKQYTYRIDLAQKADAEKYGKK